jgi:hypothetical protein
MTETLFVLDEHLVYLFFLKKKRRDQRPRIPPFLGTAQEDEIGEPG